MLSPLVGQITLGLYAALLAVGGILGFARARSRASLVSGIISAVAAVVALVLSRAGYDAGLPLGLALALVLFVVMGYRYAAKGRRLMPSGMLAIASLVVAAVLIMAQM